MQDCRERADGSPIDSSVQNPTRDTLNYIGDELNRNIPRAVSRDTRDTEYVYLCVCCALARNVKYTDNTEAKCHILCRVSFSTYLYMDTQVPAHVSCCKKK